MFGVVTLTRHRAFDLEKRQHLFATNVLKPLAPREVGIFGMGAVSDVGVDLQAAEEELEKEWSKKAQHGAPHGTTIADFKGDGASVPGREQVF